MMALDHVRPFGAWLAGCALAADLLGLLACSDPEVEAATDVPLIVEVESAVAQTRPMPRFLVVTGSLVANRQSDVAANASGLVARTSVERGRVVKRGEVLAQLDVRGAALAQAEARAQLRNAQTHVGLTDASCARARTLFEQGAATREAMERAEGECETSRGTVESATARAQLAAKALADASVRAPFDGVISERFVDVGEYVQPSSKVATLVELDPLRLRFGVDEARLGSITNGQAVSFEVEAYPGERFVGTVRFIDPALREATRELVVEAVVANADRRLRPGMFATAQVQLPEQPVVTVPEAAIRRDATTARVFVIANGSVEIVEERLVQVGVAREGFVEVSDGLDLGERVVVSPREQVRDGTHVELAQ